MPLDFTANQLLSPHIVAPFTGAWIETKCRLIITVLQSVAPFTGAWIRTFAWEENKSSQSHPSRVRGLKLSRINFEYFSRTFTGAWIEN